MPQPYGKDSDATASSSSRESLHQLLLQQRQDQEAAAGLHLPAPPSTLTHSASALGLGSFPSLGNSLPYSSFLPSAADISRQQLIRSVLAANEQQQLLEQRRRAIQEHLALQQQQQQQQARLGAYTQMALSYPQDGPSADFSAQAGEEHTRSKALCAPEADSFPQDSPHASNIQVKTEDLSCKKRSFDEMDASGHTAAETETVASARPVPVASQELKEPPSPTAAAAAAGRPSKSKAAGKKKKYTPRKYSKSDDVFLNQEPKKDVKWLQMLDELKEYKEKHGNCIVPRGYAPNPRLASWVAEQR